MEFTRIDYEHWERRELFEYFRGTTMYVTKLVDIAKFLCHITKFFESLEDVLAKMIL
ncbi:chloramphenicol acetyltransferase [Christensenellaceae bacterium OttesenSCG-928-K19]|nr:chloramphenicol acetyltransferase [Christensenellaceae bacterium OttesenSCG-928-K19]